MYKLSDEELLTNLPPYDLIELSKEERGQLRARIVSMLAGKEVELLIAVPK